MVKLRLLLLFPALSVSYDWAEGLESKFEEVETACEEDVKSCQEAALKLAVYMKKLQDLTLTYEKSTSVILDYLSKHENVVESLQGISSSGHAREFRRNQLDTLHELHKSAAELIEDLPSHELQHWLLHLQAPLM